MNQNFQMIIVGVGGQGILTVSDILGTAAIKSGLKPIMSEVHGMAQRGGVVVSEMKIGDFYSPLIGDANSDVILSFEPLEAYRALNKARKNSFVVTNNQPLAPLSVSIGQAVYPDINDMFAKIKGMGLELIEIPALELAVKAGTSRAGNVVMLGALSAVPGFALERKSIEDAIRERVSSKWIEVNLKAFNLGYEETEKQIKA